MVREITGPHEMDAVPVKALADDVAARVEQALVRMRHLPTDGLRAASRVVPFGPLRQSMAFTEGVLRQILLPEERGPSSLYPGDRDDTDETATAPIDAGMSVRSMVQGLLDRSVRQSPRQAEDANYKRLLVQLVPDEARILNALSDGNPRAMIDVGYGAPGRTPDRRLLSYATTIGTEAGIRCPDAITAYVAHLKSLDLVEFGDEDPSLREQYEILETYDEITAADEAADAQSAGSVLARMQLKSAKHEKRTITISTLAASLWEAASPDTHRFTVADHRPAPDVDMTEELN